MTRVGLVGYGSSGAGFHAPLLREAGLDLTDALCPGTVCSVNQAGVWIFRDGAHLSVPGSLQLTAMFEQTIRQVATPDQSH